MLVIRCSAVSYAHTKYKLQSNVSSTFLSSAEVARRLLMDRGNYSRIETGKTNPSSLILFKVAQVLGCEVNDFFTSD
jgi:transcriptional regulator with XRE-family HTH domain